MCTLNLPDIALSSDGDFDKFWEIFDKRAELCHEVLLTKHKRLESITSDVAPILWRDGGLGRLRSGESISKLLHGGYSSISLGYGGLYETVKFMTGESHSDEKGREFGLEIMRALNKKAEEWKKQDDIGYAVYGTPMESATYKFAKALKRRFGIIPGISDRDYITNSYHLPVFEKIDAFTKLKIESEFQELSLGGAVSYVEVPDMTNNVDAVLQLIQFMYDNIMYAEINIKNDYCLECDYHGEMELDGEAPDLYWKCPNCGNTDEKSLFVFRRTCGYCGSNFWNKGRTEEIHDRVLHLE